MADMNGLRPEDTSSLHAVSTVEAQNRPSAEVGVEPEAKSRDHPFTHEAWLSRKNDHSGL